MENSTLRVQRGPPHGLDHARAPGLHRAVTGPSLISSAWALVVLLFTSAPGLRAGESPAPVPTSGAEFLSRVREASETGDSTTLRQLLSGAVPPPADASARYDYYTTLASGCLDASQWRVAVQMIQLAGEPPAGAGNRAWIAALAHVYLGDTADFIRVALRYPTDSPSRDYLEAVRNYFAWRERGPADPSAAKLHADAWSAIVRATRESIQNHPDYSPRFHLLRCSVVEAVDDPVYLDHASAMRASAFPRLAAFLRVRLAASWALEPAKFATAASTAGLSSEEIAVWQRFAEVRARDIDALPAQAVAKLAVLPDGAEFDEARLISLRLAVRELTERIGNGEIEHVALALRYAQLAAKLAKPADAFRALRLIEAGRAASVVIAGTDLEGELAQLSGDHPRALALIRVEAKTKSRDPDWLKRHVAYVQRRDTLRAAHAFLKRLTELEPDDVMWKLALADLPDRPGDADYQLADAKEKLQIAAERVSLTPEQLAAQPETVLNSPSYRLELYSQIFSQVPAKLVPPARSWANFEKVLADSADLPFLEPEFAAHRRRVFRELVERCYRERPDHPVIAAQRRRLAEAVRAQPKP